MSAAIRGNAQLQVWFLTMHFLALGAAVLVICFQIGELVSPPGGVRVLSGSQLAAELSAKQRARYAGPYGIGTWLVRRFVAD